MIKTYKQKFLIFYIHIPVAYLRHTLGCPHLTLETQGQGHIRDARSIYFQPSDIFCWLLASFLPVQNKTQGNSVCFISSQGISGMYWNKIGYSWTTSLHTLRHNRVKVCLSLIAQSDGGQMALLRGCPLSGDSYSGCSCSNWNTRLLSLLWEVERKHGQPFPHWLVWASLLQTNLGNAPRKQKMEWDLVNMCHGLLFARMICSFHQSCYCLITHGLSSKASFCMNLNMNSVV